MAAPADIASEQEVRSALESARQILRNVASFRRRTNRADATAYRLQRQAGFLALERLPPATDGKTLVAPPTELKGRLEGLVGLSKWDALIDTAESGMRGDALFWLDLH